MGRKKASDFPEELLNLTAPPFLDRAQKICCRRADRGSTQNGL
jgi:hypothetical protein